jgi:serpin B
MAMSSRAIELSADRVLMESLEPRTLFSAAPAATPAQLVAQANNAFAFDLFQQLSKNNSGNIFFSPYSADTALEMALQGAKGVTAMQMIQALDLPSADIAQAGIAALYQLFQPDANAGYTLSTANRLWVNQNFPLLQSFIDSSQSIFGAGPQTVDFSDPTAAANTINTWVSQQTNGKIQNLVPAGDLGPLTALVITNAIYFKGNWASPFEPYMTQQAAFQIASTEAATAEMMQQTGGFDYYQQTGPDGFQALDMPYQGGDLDMLVILPTTYDLDQFQSTLTAGLFSQITSNLTMNDVNVHLPQFEMDETYHLIPALQNMGIQTAFTPDADFSGMFEPQFNTSYSIGDVIQKTHIQVDETGTEAAAATAIIIRAQITAIEVGPPPVPILFDANHPFIFAIRDAATNTILFLGQVTDPSNGTADYATSPTALPAPGGLSEPGNPIGGIFQIIQWPDQPLPIATLLPSPTPSPVASPAPGPVAPVAAKTRVRPAIASPVFAAGAVEIFAPGNAGEDLLSSSIGPSFAAGDVLGELG